jgi:hypothetical protein
MSVRLKKVTMLADTTNEANGLVARTYNIAYRASHQSGRQLVESIRECGADNVCLPATTFTWSDETWSATGKRFTTDISIAPSALPFSLPLSQQQIVWAADWNGDGRSDLIGWKRTPITDGHKFELFVCTIQPDARTFYCGNQPIVTEAVLFGEGLPVGRVHVMDFNNDGLADVIYRPDTFAPWQFHQSIGGNSAFHVGSFNSAPSSPDVPVYQGDFNGDGRIDILTWKDDHNFQICFTVDAGLHCMDRIATSQGVACPGTEPNCDAFASSLAKFEILVADVDPDRFATSGRSASRASTGPRATGSAMNGSSKDPRARSTRRS